MSNLSPAELTWVLMNHFKDQEEDWKKYEALCRFINPDAAAQLFDGKIVEKTESTEDFMLEQMYTQLKGKYSKEELKAMMDDPKHASELTVIKREKK